MAVVSMTKFKTLTYFKFKVFSLLTILFLGFFLAGCGGGGEGSPNNPISSVTYSISFYDENLDFITTRQIEEGTDISSVEPYSTAWFKANETSPLPTNYNLNESVTIYAIPNVQEITTQEELVAISANVITLRHKYILLNDITLAEGKSGFDSISGWTPIGDYTNRFKGIFNGNGYKITNIWINKPNVNNIGLFGYIEYGQIKNIGVETAKGKGIKGNSLVGGITGYINRGNISNSYTVGNISGSSDYVGGIAGHINRSSIYNSYTVGNISGSSDYVGGIAGYIEYGGNIANSYSIGYISGNSNVGGIAGYIDYGKNISNSYSIANISGYGYYVGGIAGYSVVGTIQNNVAINPFITGKLYVNRVIGTTRSGSSSINNFASIGAVGGADYNGKTNSFSNNNNAQYHGIDKTVDLLKKKNTYLSGSLDWKFDGYNDNEPWVWGAFSDYPYPTFYWQVQKP
ncbi:MAG: hypothetical protein LBT96_03290 [Campylobacteraceae bacterium]|jgi:hypothetical protein|nr:hypothetical protein [Campylobacteraceae bacterium]